MTLNDCYDGQSRQDALSYLHRALWSQAFIKIEGLYYESVKKRVCIHTRTSGDFFVDVKGKDILSMLAAVIERIQFWQTGGAT